MAVLQQLKTSLKLTVTAVIFAALLASPSLAQSNLFQPTYALRSALNSTPQGVSSRTPVALGESIDPSFFNVSLKNKNLFGLSTRVRSSKSSLRSSSSKTTETTRGVLIDEEGAPIGSYVSSEISQNGKSAYNILFRIAATGEHFVLSESSDGTYNLDEHNHDEMPDCGHDHHEGEEEEALDHDTIHSLARTTRSTSQTKTLDVLVLYTPEAVEYSGSEISMQATVAQAIELANESYDNSNVPLRLNLAHTVQTLDNETGSFAKDLTSLQVSGDGQYDEAHNLRNQHYADMVVLMTAPGAYCGIGYTPSNVASIQTGNAAFSVVAANCVNYYSFQHEIGHNLGLQHDVSNAASVTAFDDSYGYHWTGDNNVTYRSVMAYSPGVRVPHFSNPDVTYRGGATGENGAANNAAVLIAASSLAVDYRTNPNESEQSEGEETPEESSENIGEGEVERIAESLEVSETRSKRSFEFSMRALDSDGNGVGEVEVLVYQTRKKGQRLLSSLTADSEGNVEYSAKRKRRTIRLSFQLPNGTSVEKRVQKRTRGRKGRKS